MEQSNAAQTPLVTRSMYNIQQDYLSAIQELEENGGELTEELEERLMIAEADFAMKSEAYVKVINVLESDIVAIQKETTRLITLAHDKETVIERIKNVLLKSLLMFGNKDPKKDIYRFDGKSFKLGTRKSISTEIGETFNDNRFLNFSISCKFSSDEIKLLSNILAQEKHALMSEAVILTDGTDNKEEMLNVAETIDSIGSRISGSLKSSPSKTDIKEFILSKLPENYEAEGTEILSIEEVKDAYLQSKYNLTIK